MDLSGQETVEQFLVQAFVDSVSTKCDGIIRESLQVVTTAQHCNLPDGERRVLGAVNLTVACFI